MNGQCFPTEEKASKDTGLSIRQFLDEGKTCGDPLNVCETSESNSDSINFLGYQDITFKWRNEDIIIPENYFCIKKFQASVDSSQNFWIEINRTEGSENQTIPAENLNLHQLEYHPPRTYVDSNGHVHYIPAYYMHNVY